MRLGLVVLTLAMQVAIPISTPMPAAQAPPDPEVQLAALRQARGTGNALTDWTTETRILTLLLDRFPSRTPEIVEAIERVGAAVPSTVPAGTRVSMLVSVLGKAVEAGVGLEKIEQIVAPLVTQLSSESFATAARALATRTRRPPPSDEDLRADYITTRVEVLLFTGRLHARLGRLDQASEALEEVLTLHPGVGQAALQLAAIDQSRGRERSALEHYLFASLTVGKLSPEQSSAMRTLYRKLHGSEAGMEAEMERVYVARLPNPIPHARYAPAAPATGRVALVELFTGSGCFPCVAADLAFDGIVDNFPEALVAPLVYHRHAPEPDPMTTPASDVRALFYQANGVPRVFYNGVSGEVGGGNRTRAVALYQRYRDSVEQALGAPPEAAVSVNASRTGERIHVDARISGLPRDARFLRLQIVLAEKQLHFHGENGIHLHPMVVRAAAGEQSSGFPIAQATDGAARVDAVFDLGAIAKAIADDLAENISVRRAKAKAAGLPEHPYLAEGRAIATIDPAALVVVAYVQASDRRVLQAARTNVPLAGRRP